LPPKRSIIAAFEEASITIASTTFEVVGLPPVKVNLAESQPADLHEANA